MYNNKAIYYFELLASILIVAPLYKYIGITKFWFYEIPYEASVFLLMITIPIGTYVLIRKVFFLIKWFINTCRGS